MSLSASRNLVPLAYNCQSGMARRAHGSKSSPCPAPEDEQITAQANEAKALSILSPRRRREQEIDELEAEHQVEVLAKDDEAEETRTAQADKIVTLGVSDDDVDDAARTEIEDVKESQNDATNTSTDIAMSKEMAYDVSKEEGETREMANDTVTSIQAEDAEDEGRSVESIEEQKETEAYESREQFDEPVEDEVEEPVENEIPTANSRGYIPALLSKVLDENGYLNCC